MSRLLWLLAGLAGGVIVGRNAEPMADPAGAAVVLALVAGCGLCWVGAYRGKSTAVAAAVAHAQAVAEADAEAHAAAIAQAAVHLHMNGGQQAPSGADLAAGMLGPGPAAHQVAAGEQTQLAGVPAQAQRAGVAAAAPRRRRAATYGPL